MGRTRVSKLAKTPKAISRLLDSANKGELVAIIGTGVSLSLTKSQRPSLSWKGLILDGFERARTIGKISDKQFADWDGQRSSDDLDDLLAAAEFMGRKMEAPKGDLYARWLRDVFSDVKPVSREMTTAVRGLHSLEIPLVTLNYDSLLEQVTGLQPINITETTKVMAWLRRESQGILHLHGNWEAPTTCILGIRDYQTTIEDDVRDLIQRSLGAFKRLLFIGCGDSFADPNFSSLIRWLRTRLGTATHEHYALVLNSEVKSRSADPDWLGFVEPLGYGASHGELATFLASLFSSSRIELRPRKSKSSKAASATILRASALKEYASFLVRDCGQMTIEGMRADMDTAQRRFDLERLFVPIKLSPAPPDLPANDPDRAEKLIRWKEKNEKAEPFGKVFKETRRLVLLALPGGGKSMLLKRVAVAYADPGRRTASPDELPDLNLTPVMIRCREWREHIHRPIPALLDKIPEITGQAGLSGLYTALAPLFKAGRVLLLVDGLDEIHDDALRLIFVEHLETFLRENPRTRLVVTSREAGFNLVAPSLVRFCERRRIASLEPDAIHTLCNHWHSLMTGDSPEALSESKNLAELLIKNNSLHKLAENPLLLTMLLVVKHGAGRLPPDRVSLYGRAVEVLLDTWNIKGHDSLSPKEAVPQLACVAFRLMLAGKQTATGKEILSILEEARDRVPQIRRYAKDTPADFLKRVELRSSLLVEAGYQADGNGTVPFYQFRHLTFQEYLAAVAAVEGHYIEYDKSDTVLSPLAEHLTAEEWKEVIPMSAGLTAAPLHRKDG